MTINAGGHELLLQPSLGWTPRPQDYTVGGEPVLTLRRVWCTVELGWSIDL